MRVRPALALAAAALPLPGAGDLQPLRAGEAFLVTLDHRVEQTGTDGSSSSSTDRDGYAERVVAVRGDGVELDYDFAPGTDHGERDSDWHLPARVLKPKTGPLRLLNAAALAARVDPWLKAAGMTRAACGRWIFTWNAFRIDCEPATVVPVLERLQLTPEELRAGATYADPDAAASGQLAPASAGVFRVVMPIDGDRVRRAEAEADAMMRQLGGGAGRSAPVRIDHAAERIAGTVTVTLETGGDGRVRRRIRVLDYRITSVAGVTQHVVVRDTAERRPLPTPDGGGQPTPGRQGDEAAV